MAAEPTTDDISKISPHSLITNFTKTRIWHYLAAAIVIHIIVILITSIGYLKAQISGEEPVVEEAVAEGDAQPGSSDSADTAATTDTAVAQPTTSTGAGSDTAVVNGGTGTEGEGADPNNPENSEMMKRLNETADPSEIPDEPDALGIDINDTNID